MAKRVLITGGNKGIGLAVTKLFQKAGYDIAVIGRDFTDFHEEGVETFSYDLTDVAGIPKLVEEIGPVDILINNAGIDRKYPYDAYPEEEIEKIVNVNLKAPLALINGYAPLFLSRGEGRIVNVASQAAEIGHTDVWYGITKAGLVNATKSYAALLGAKGVVINGVAPGPVETDMIKDSPFSERFETLRNRTYTRRLATAEEVAKVIFWLATDAPEYVNGEIVDINNGAQRIRV